MARPAYLYVLMYGKRPIAGYTSKSAAEAGLESLKLVIPKAYPVKPHLVKVLRQG